MVNRQKIKGTKWENDLVKIVKDNVPLTKQAKRVAGSGAIGNTLNEPLLKGDVVFEFYGFPQKFRIEAKTGYGGNSQLTVRREWINKIIEEAEESYSIPALACKFLGAKEGGGVQYFIIFDLDTFMSIINYVNDLKRELDLVYESIGE